MYEQLAQEALELCWAIEKLPASTQQTDLSLQASALHRKLRDLADKENRTSDD